MRVNTAYLSKLYFATHKLQGQSGINSQSYILALPRLSRTSKLQRYPSSAMASPTKAFATEETLANDPVPSECTAEGTASQHPGPLPASSEGAAVAQDPVHPAIRRERIPRSPQLSRMSFTKNVPRQQRMATLWTPWIASAVPQKSG